MSENKVDLEKVEDKKEKQPERRPEPIKGPKIIGQFGKDKQLNNILHKKVVVISSSIVIAIIVVISFHGPVKRDTAGGTIQFPESINADGTLNFPLYDRTEDRIARSSSRRGRSRYKPPTVFSPPARFDRSELLKISPGTEATGTLLSGATDGFIKVTLSGSSSNDALPKGSILIGKGTSRDDRLHISFTKLIHPDGKVQPVRAIALDDTDHTAGLNGSNVSHYGWKIAASAALHFLGGVSDGMRERENMNGLPVAKPNLKNAALGGLSQASIELATERMNKARAERPRYTIPFGTQIRVLFTGN